MIVTVKDAARWALEFEAVEGITLELRQKGRRCLQGQVKDGRLTCEVFTYEKDTSVILAAELPKEAAQIRLIWRSYRVELWADGVCVDEEWPIGDCLRTGEVTCTAKGLTAVSLCEDIDCPPEADQEIGNAQYWMPPQENSGVGDCMPFFDGERYHLYYLKDRRSHQSKYRLGAHQFAHLSTTDLHHWVSHPLAVPITHQWEGSICTGSIIQEKGIYYAFYAVRMADGTSAQLSWASGTDGIHFEKSEQYFTLTAPYETSSARDPHVFKDAEGLFHMLVTTDYLGKLPEQRTGCLAHLTSADLKNWEQQEPFTIPGYTDQPECTDYFEWNGWYYYLFSNYGCAKYRYARSPKGPWLKPDREILDGLLYRVPKTAAFFGNRRIAAGFLCKEMNGQSYGGNVVFREILQNADGTLSTALVPEMLPPVPKQETKLTVAATEPDHYAVETVGTLGKTAYAVVQMRPEHRNTCYGLTLTQPDGDCYEIRLEPWRGVVAVCQAHRNPFTTPQWFCLDTVTGLEDVVSLEVVLKGDVIDVCINNQVTLVRRTDHVPSGTWELGCFSKDGRTEFSLSY